MGASIFLSSHILPEVEHTCDRVGIIREGAVDPRWTMSAPEEPRHHEVRIGFAGPGAGRNGVPRRCRVAFGGVEANGGSVARRRCRAILARNCVRR